MELKINNFAKIKEADIIIDGITVIAGNNNIGKSTVGKVLDAVFNATYNIDENMNKARIDSLAWALRNDFERNNDNVITPGRHYSISIYRQLAQTILGGTKEDIEKICKEYLNLMHLPLEHEERFYKIILERLEENAQISDESFCKAIYTNYFGDIFHEHINSLFNREEPAEIVLTVKDKDVRLVFDKEECTQEERQFDIINNSLYIDDPFVIDEMNLRTSYGMSGISVHKRIILEKMMYAEDKAIEEKAFSNLLVSNKIEEIIQLINRVASGNISKKQKYMYQLSEDSSKEIDVASLSTGLKAFLILKQILLNGNLNEKDVIILDEPEIHLHPEWQLVYAEIIVLLQKRFNFHIIVTTHSAHFLEALELYSKKYGIDVRCNYYLASLQGNGAVFKNVTDNISEIYKQMVDPALLLSRLREELESEDDEL